MHPWARVLGGYSNIVCSSQPRVYPFLSLTSLLLNLPGKVFDEAKSSHGCVRTVFLFTTMPKVDINKVAEVMKKNNLDPAVLRRIIEELNLASQPDPGMGDEETAKVKKQYAILVSDPHGLIETDFTGWVLQIPEEESPLTVQERLLKATYEYNASKKGRLYPAKTIGDAIEAVPAKFFKEADLWIKTKEPVLILRTNNEIPKDTPNV